MKKLLGELLIEGKEITQEQLNEALRIQKKDGDLLGAILVNLGYLDEGVLLEFLKMQGTQVKMHQMNL
jgi:type IV pilus assembly protein PilB